MRHAGRCKENGTCESEVVRLVPCGSSSDSSVLNAYTVLPQEKFDLYGFCELRPTWETILLSPSCPLPLIPQVSYTQAASSDQFSDPPGRNRPSPSSHHGHAFASAWVIARLLRALVSSSLAPNRPGRHIRQRPPSPSPSSSSVPQADWAKQTASSQTSGS